MILKKKKSFLENFLAITVRGDVLRSYLNDTKSREVLKNFHSNYLSSA